MRPSVSGYGARIVIGTGCIALISTVVTVLLLLVQAWYLAEIIGAIAAVSIVVTAAVAYVLTPPTSRRQFVDAFRALKARPLEVNLARGLGSAAAGLGVLAVWGIGLGTWQVITNHDGFAYTQATKPQVSATFVSAADGSGRECDVVVTAGTTRLTARVNGSCNVHAIPDTGTGLRIEEWDGKVTNLYWETGTWTTLDNPSPGFSFGVTCLIAGAAVGLLSVLVGLLQAGVQAIVRRRSRDEVDRLLPMV
jgi:hypothetical protein